MIAGALADEVDGFPFVEIAIGGVNRRNRVVRINDVPKLVAASSKIDCYTSCFRFTEDFARYTATNAAPKTGRPPSVSGYPGLALATFVPFDFDCEEDPGRALTDLRIFIERLHDEHDVPAEALRLAFSGRKGFSVELPASLFGCCEASEDVADRLKAVAGALLVGIKTADFAIYEKLRLWRVLNTRHAGSGLYKVQLTAAEVLHCSIEEIRGFARGPRRIELPDEEDFATRSSLASLWQNSAQAEPSRVVQGRAIPAALLEKLVREGVGNGARNSRCAQLIGHLLRRDVDALVVLELALAWNRCRCRPPLSDDEVAGIVESIVARERRRRGWR